MPEAIAIIGLDCIFPGADGAAAFWRMLVEGGDAIGLVPKQRWDAEAYYDSDPSKPAKISSKWGGFVEGLDRFDAEFFGITPEEARRIDPQHKLLLEVSYRALENAGLPVKALAGSQTGVFVGIGHGDHEQKLKRDVQSIDANLGVHAYRCFAANRLSYHLNLQGPSLAVDAACSSSLAALHLACQSLQCGESDLAIAAGVNAHLLPEESMSSTKMGLLSPDGRCRSFAADAAGHARSEGAGVVVLKRMRDAQADGNPILASIRSSALNHNGASNGITAPNGPAQVRVLRRALSLAGIAPSDVSYLEAHATGTPLGEQVELSALQEVFAADRAKEAPCLIGSLKSNLGHLEAAAGIAGVIKTVLALHNQLIPRSLYGAPIHPALAFGTALRPVSENVPWPRSVGAARIAGVSAFSFGGVNAHVLLEEGPASARPMVAQRRPLELLLLSAKTEGSLAALKQRMATFLRSEDAPDVADVCWSLRNERSPFALRCAVLGADGAQLAEHLASEQGPHDYAGRAARLVRVVFRSSPSGRSSAGLVAQLRTAWPEQCGKALSRAEHFAVRISDAPQRERLLVECTLCELLLGWGVAPTYFVADDDVGSWTGAYVRARLGRGEPNAPLPCGLIDLKSGSVSNPDCLPAAAKVVSLASGTASSAADAQVVAPFADGQQLWPNLLSALGQLWVAGLNIDWTSFDAEHGAQHVLVPNYAFDKQPSWLP